jgi:hypothetical protein
MACRNPGSIDQRLGDSHGLKSLFKRSRAAGTSCANAENRGRD